MEISLFAMTNTWGEGNSDAGLSPLQGVQASNGDATWLYR